ncbi:unnamed protein product [Rotaria sordida]|uniref:VCBS repeat-containing protein n=1 Tax=Rotaria sordida TaxID=392033 RepID=A0A819N5T6_9BILA|nr:unnamed protein product [Rotaria sordida]
MVIDHVDNDNRYDIITLDSSSQKIDILYNDGNRTFTIHTISLPTILWLRPVSTADVNNDNKRDTVILDSEFKKILIYLNNGNRKFTEHMNYSIGTDPLFLTTEDLNADGYSDIIIGYRSAEGVSVQLNDGNGMFPGEAVFYRTVCPSHFVTIADLNGDHTLDIIALCPSVHKIVILFNNW